MNCWICKHFPLGAIELTLVWFPYDEFVCFLAYSVIAAASVMPDSVWPHTRQPTRLRRPWDSPGKNTGVHCHFLLQCMKMKSEREGAQLCLTLWDPMDRTVPRLLRPWDFLGKSTGVGCHCLLHIQSLGKFKWHMLQQAK